MPLLLRERLLLLGVTLGAPRTQGPRSPAASSAAGDGVLMSDTEKRPCTVGDLPLAGDGLLDLGDVFPDDGDFGDAFLLCKHQEAI